MPSLATPDLAGAEAHGPVDRCPASAANWARVNASVWRWSARPAWSKSDRAESISGVGPQTKASAAVQSVAAPSSWAAREEAVEVAGARLVGEHPDQAHVGWSASAISSSSSR